MLLFLFLFVVVHTDTYQKKMPAIIHAGKEWHKCTYKNCVPTLFFLGIYKEEGGKKESHLNRFGQTKIENRSH